MDYIPGARLRLLELVYMDNRDGHLPTHTAIERAERLFDWVYKDVCVPTNDVLPKLDLINSKLDQVMTKQERFDSILTQLNDVTNNIAADYQALLEEVRQGTVSDESLTKAEQNIETLKQIAAQKENPVPASGTGTGTVSGEEEVDGEGEEGEDEEA